MKPRKFLRAVSIVDLDTCSGESPFPLAGLSTIEREVRADRLEASRCDWWMRGADFTGGDYIE